MTGPIATDTFCRRRVLLRTPSSREGRLKTGRGRVGRGWVGVDAGVGRVEAEGAKEVGRWQECGVGCHHLRRVQIFQKFISLPRLLTSKQGLLDRWGCLVLCVMIYAKP